MDLLEQYYFNLPAELIAQNPPFNRGESRLMIVNKGNKIVPFCEILNFIPKNTLFVFNEAKVTPARLIGKKQETGARVEVLIVNFSAFNNKADSYDLDCIVKPGKHFKIGTKLLFNASESLYNLGALEKNDELEAEVLEIKKDGQRKIRFYFKDSPLKVLDNLGHIPLPPYIKRPDNKEDRKRYQTVFAKTEGAIAAPTAGLHFTEKLLNNLKAQGHGVATVLLKVGLGTFSPLSNEQIISEKLHSEEINVSAEVVEKIKKAKQEKHKILVVGTTTARALEWAARTGELKPYVGETNMFIKPPYKFNVPDIFLTNFHLPSSSLLMMVAAFMGYDNLMASYKEAISMKMKFFSYGDAMLIS